MYRFALVLPALLFFTLPILSQQPTPNPPPQNPSYAAIPVEAARAQNPVKSTPESLARAKKWWKLDCEMCHGKNGDGKGETARDMKLTKQISPGAMRRSFQDAMREAQVANVVVRSISGHLTEQMQQRYSTARGHEQESAIARIIDLTQVQQRMRRGKGAHRDSKGDSIEGQHDGTG